MMVKYEQTPVGYAAYQNKLKCVEAIASVPGVNLSLGVCFTALLFNFLSVTPY